MQVTPHVHAVEIRREWAYRDGGFWYVKYGDTTVRAPFAGVPRWRLWALNRAIHKAIRRHDRGSLKAGRTAALKSEAVYLAASFQFDPQRWGSEQLDQRFE